MTDDVDREIADNYVYALTHSAHAPLACPACAASIFGVTDFGDPALCVACRALVVLDADVVDIAALATSDPETAAEIAALGAELGVDIGEEISDGTACAVRVYLRRPTDEEEELFLRMPSIQRAIEMVAHYHERHGAPPS
jgi:hypothetical protein